MKKFILLLTLLSFNISSFASTSDVHALNSLSFPCSNCVNHLSPMVSLDGLIIDSNSFSNMPNFFSQLFNPENVFFILMLLCISMMLGVMYANKNVSFQINYKLKPQQKKETYYIVLFLFMSFIFILSLNFISYLALNYITHKNIEHYTEFAHNHHLPTKNVKMLGNTFMSDKRLFIEVDNKFYEIKTMPENTHYYLNNVRLIQVN